MRPPPLSPFFALLALELDADEPELSLAVEDAPEWPDYRSSPSNFVYTRQQSTVEKDDFRKDGIDFIKSLGWELSA